MTKDRDNGDSRVNEALKRENTGSPEQRQGAIIGRAEVAQILAGNWRPTGKRLA